jgi:hypothetical protein
VPGRLRPPRATGAPLLSTTNPDPGTPPQRLPRPPRQTRQSKRADARRAAKLGLAPPEPQPSEQSSSPSSSRSRRPPPVDTLGLKFGPADPRSGEDRRKAERRGPSLTGEALDRRLRELNVGDRRVVNNRRHNDRRKTR